MPVTPILYLTCPLQKHHQEMSEHTWELPPGPQARGRTKPHTPLPLWAWVSGRQGLGKGRNLPRLHWRTLTRELFAGASTTCNSACRHEGIFPFSKGWTPLSLWLYRAALPRLACQFLVITYRVVHDCNILCKRVQHFISLVCSRLPVQEKEGESAGAGVQKPQGMYVWEHISPCAGPVINSLLPCDTSNLGPLAQASYSWSSLKISKANLVVWGWVSWINQQHCYHGQRSQNGASFLCLGFIICGQEVIPGAKIFKAS